MDVRIMALALWATGSLDPGWISVLESEAAFSFTRVGPGWPRSPKPSWTFFHLIVAVAKYLQENGFSRFVLIWRCSGRASINAWLRDGSGRAKLRKTEARHLKEQN
jgi:hypothetical protein